MLDVRVSDQSGAAAVDFSLRSCCALPSSVFDSVGSEDGIHGSTFTVMLVINTAGRISLFDSIHSLVDSSLATNAASFLATSSTGRERWLRDNRSGRANWIINWSSTASVDRLDLASLGCHLGKLGPVLSCVILRHLLLHVSRGLDVRTLKCYACFLCSRCIISGLT